MNAGSNEEDARAEARERVGGGFVSELADRIGSRAAVTAVFGEPVERDGVTVIPVAKAAWGVGGGGGSGDEGEGFGAGGGMKVIPHGFIELSTSGARYRTIQSPLRSALLVLGAAVAGACAVLLLQRRGR